MELKFNSVEELIEFIEKMGWVKKDENDKENGSNLTLTKVSSCPYGFINCPYNKSITPYYPTITTPYCNTDVGASKKFTSSWNKGNIKRIYSVLDLHALIESLNSLLFLIL